jgi:hypothetical protein
MSAPLLVTARNAAVTVETLQMRCEADTEMPEPLDDEVFGRWIGMGHFGGEAKRHHADGLEGSIETAVVDGSVALVLTTATLLVIVAPMTTEPAVWIAAPPRELAIEPLGAEGLFRKRPRLAQLSTPSWKLQVGLVSEVHGRYAKKNQTGALLERLSSARAQIEN